MYLPGPKGTKNLHIFSESIRKSRRKAFKGKMKKGENSSRKAGRHEARDFWRETPGGFSAPAPL